MSKVILAIVMSRESLDDRDWAALLKQVLNKMDKAESKDTFYICMALDKEKINPSIIDSDIYYTLYLNASRYLKEYDLF